MGQHTQDLIGLLLKDSFKHLECLSLCLTRPERFQGTMVLYL